MSKGHLRWRGQSIEVSVHAGKGRYVRETVRWQGTKKETERSAERVKRRLLDELDIGGHAGPDATVAQLVARWRRHAEPDWSPTTAAAYGSYLRNHIIPAIGDMKVIDVRPGTLDDLYASLRAKKLSAASIGKVHVILRRAFSEAVRWRWLTSNPATDARPPKVRRPEITPPTAAQVKKLIGLAEKTDPTFHAFVVVAADTGARRGEVLAVRWRNLNLDTGDLTIERAVVLDHGKVVDKDTKTHESRRIALGAPCVTVLARLRRRQLESALAAGHRLSDDAYLFTSEPDGSRPWRPDGVTSRFATLRKRAAITNVRLHDLRHGLITDWLAAGVDPRTVMGRVGHASLQTLTRYSHFVPAKDREAADRLGDRHSG